MKNLLKEKIKTGEKVLGTFFEMGSVSAVECLGLAGMDYLIIDTEHGPFDVESSMSFIMAAELRNITPLVRIKDPTRPSVLKMLDIGAKGLIIPCIQTMDEVKKLVEYGKFYPTGQRGLAFARSSGFGFDPITSDIDSYFATCNNETMIIPQCETKGCLDNIEAIAAVEGVDGIFIGPYDLSVALGKPAKFSDPEVTSAIARILKACKDAKKFCMIYAGNAEAAKQYFNQGFEGAAVTMDTVIYISAFKALIKEAKE